MYSRFDINRFALQQLPPLLRKKGIYALLRCLLIGLGTIYRSFTGYRESVLLQVNHNSSTASLQKFLNNLFGLQDSITITDFKDVNVYLHNEDETNETVYMGYQDESIALNLSSVAPNMVTGGFEVNVPNKLVSADNLKTIRKWVDFYKPAGTTYKIKFKTVS